MAPAHLQSMPPELFSAILDHVEIEDLQVTTFSLLRALPTAPIPQHHLFLNITLKSGPQVLLLWKRLVHSKEEAGWVRYFSFKGWKVDADVLNKCVE